MTRRAPIQLQSLSSPTSEAWAAVCLSSDHNIYRHTQSRRPRPRRAKAYMKQIVGGAFHGIDNETLEQEIARDLAHAAAEYEEDPRAPKAQQVERLDRILDRILEKVRALLGGRVNSYLDVFARRLFDPRTKLRWNLLANNCQDFCDNLLSTTRFSSLFHQSSLEPQPLYLLSFVCRPGSYARPKIRSKLDVPFGLTEEYLLQFRYGRHCESDIVDTLQEYFYDWGAFGSNLYPHQALFPWDCTEAYGRYPTKCNDCGVAKHVWSFPFDSWSIIQLHLQRDRTLYGGGHTNNIMTNTQWMENRLELLLAHHSLCTVAAAMVKHTNLPSDTTWISLRRDGRKDRLKLGGIHRAQPFSNHYEENRYHEYLLAPWALLKREHQIEQYELLRDGRMRQRDVGLPGKIADRPYDLSDRGLSTESLNTEDTLLERRRHRVAAEALPPAAAASVTAELWDVTNEVEVVDNSDGDWQEIGWMGYPLADHEHHHHNHNQDHDYNHDYNQGYDHGYDLGSFSNPSGTYPDYCTEAWDMGAVIAAEAAAVSKLRQSP